MTFASEVLRPRDGDGVAERLTEAGFAAERAADVAGRVKLCATVVGRGRSTPDSATVAFAVPGRIEVLGKHTDYGGGRSLLAAAERGFVVAGVPRNGSWVTVTDARSGEAIRLPRVPEIGPVAGWGNYPATVVRRLVRNFPGSVAGADLAFHSDLPAAAGISSSSALVVAVSLTLIALNGLDGLPAFRAQIGTAEQLAGYLACVENGQHFGTLAGDAAGVGTQGGSEDHTAMLCARPGALVQYAFTPVRFERAVPLPANHTFVVAASGVAAEKTGAARECYNLAARRLREVAEIWRGTGGTGSLGSAADHPQTADRLTEAIERADPTRFSVPELLARWEHFRAESGEIVPGAADALLRGDLRAFGALVDRSQRLAEVLLENQVAETVWLARSAREAGAVAASVFGAGFGGSVWALISDAEVDRFEDAWRRAYLHRFPEHRDAANFFRAGAGPPVVRLA